MKKNTRRESTHFAGRVSADLIYSVVLVTIPLIVFARLLSCDFLSWDDRSTVAQNPLFSPPTSAAWVQPWLHPQMDLYVPVTYMAWAAISFLAWDEGALHPALFHAANILLHLSASLVLFRILRQLKLAPFSACVGVLIFAVHPVQVEAVAWISGLKDVLAGLLSLIAIWQFQCYLLRADRKWRHYTIALLCFTLALLSKPSAIVVPGILLALATFAHGVPIRRTVFSLVPWVLPAVACFFWTKAVQPANYPAISVPLSLRPLIATDALSFYLYQLVWPVALAVDYGRTPEHVLQEGGLYLTWLVPLAVAAIAWFTRRKVPFLAMGLAIAVIAISPVLGLIRFDFQLISTVADHYLYLSMIGIALAGAGLTQKWLARGVTPARLALPVGIVAVLGIGSFLQAGFWREDITLFSHALEVNSQSWAACNTLASAAVERRDGPAALNLARRAISLKPDDPRVIGTLGAAMGMTGDIPGATAAYTHVLTIAPDDAQAHAALAGLLAQERHFVEAELHARRAIQLDPSNALARMNLGTLLAQSGRTGEGIEQLQTAVQLAPGKLPQAHANLGFLLLGEGQPSRAAAQFQAALSIDPNFPPARMGLQKAIELGGR